MVRWHNLFFCGGYSNITFANGELVDTNDRLLDAVSNGLKPTGFWPLTSEELEETLRKVKQTDLIWKVSNNEHPRFEYEIGVVNQGSLPYRNPLSPTRRYRCHLQQLELFSPETSINL